MKVCIIPFVLGGHVGSRSVLWQLTFATFGLSVGVARSFATLVGAAQVQLDAPGPRSDSQLESQHGAASAKYAVEETTVPCCRFSMAAEPRSRK